MAKSAWKIQAKTWKLFPIIAGILLLSVFLANLNNTMAASMSTILGILAVVILIAGVLFSEAQSSKIPKMLRWLIYIVAIAVILAVVPPVLGVTVPYLTALAIWIEAFGAILAFILLFV